MKLQISELAGEDLVAGFRFYEEQSPGVGSYFLDSLFSDIDSLLLYAGTHREMAGYYRAISRRFPFAIYYKIESEQIRVRRILDCRRNPVWISRQLKKS